MSDHDKLARSQEREADAMAGRVIISFHPALLRTVADMIEDRPSLNERAEELRRLADILDHYIEEGR